MEQELWPGWKTVRLIGQGSFGKVYEICRENIGGFREKAALKVIVIPPDSGEIESLYDDGLDQQSITRRFSAYLEEIVKEYNLMAAMKGCANIVYCDDLRYIQHEDQMGWDIYIKMERLTPMLRGLPREVTEEQVIRIGVDICQALVFCQQKHILHRDIKPQNIFISDDGSYKLGDFGIAKVSERTTGGTKTGTYRYMAPEIYNNQPYGSSVDLYSLGMVLYWLLNERRIPFLPLPPQSFTVEDEVRARFRRMAGEPLPPPVNGSERLKQIVQKACAFRPNDRFGSAGEMLETLQELQRKAPTQSEYSEEDTEDRTVAMPMEFLHRKDEGNWKAEEARRAEEVRKAEEARRAKEARRAEEERRTAAEAREIAEKAARAAKVCRIPEEPYQEKGPSAEAVRRENTGKREEKPKKPQWIALASAVVVAVAAVAGMHFLTRPVTVPEEETEPLVQATTTPAAKPAEPTVQTKITETVPVDRQEPEHKILRAYATDWVARNAGTGTLSRDLTQVASAPGNRLGQNRDYTFGLDRNGRLFDLVSGEEQGWADIVDIAGSDYIYVGIKSDGTAISVGVPQTVDCPVDVSDWDHLTEVDVSIDHAVGLKKDGTVVATGSNYEGECNVENWSDIISVKAGLGFTVGLKSDHTVVCTAADLAVSGWNNVESIYTGGRFVAGLRKDGTVCFASRQWDYWLDMSGWRDIVKVVTSELGIAGLRADGTVVAASKKEFCDGKNMATGGAVIIKRVEIIPAVFTAETASWTDITDIAMGEGEIVGLRKDGTVVAAWEHEDYDSRPYGVGYSQIQNWKDIKGIWVGGGVIIGMT